ncbi:alpha/beta hydrolase [Spirillospora sp. NPDC047279]|uniref:alpha/beta hydrolase n=1 Tax=Spirillospora sp. NPDC047279 TaxID=3155478 RepID=UPI0033D2F9F8
MSLVAAASALVAAGALILLLLPPVSMTMWQLGLMVAEFSLALAVVAAVGCAASVSAHRAGARRTATVAGVLCLAALAASLVPVVSGWRAAQRYGVALSPTRYFAGLSTDADQRPHTEVYTTAGGRQLRLDVWRPRGEEPRDSAAPGGAGAGATRPAVVMVHGGDGPDVPRSSTPRWDVWLAERGHVVFDIDYRAFPPGRWKEPPGDVKCAVGWVKQNAARFGVDPSRITLMGQSAGGYLSLLAAYTAGDGRIPPSCPADDTSVRAVVAFYPPADWTYIYRQGPTLRTSPWFVADGREKLRSMMGGTPDTVPEDYRLASPITHVRAGLPPTLLVQGGRDPLQPPDDTERLAARLAGARTPHRLVEIPYADHFFDISWGGWATQISRAEVASFLAGHGR